jgi:prevent-host-death family protein
MTKMVNVHEAKTHLSRLLVEVQQGKEIIIAKSGHPIARLSPATYHPSIRIPGSAKTTVVIAPDFDAPLPDAILNTFT